MTRPASEKGRRLVASYGEARDLLPDTAVAVEHSHTALLAYVAALEKVAADAQAASIALKRIDDGDYDLNHEFELDNAWERLRASLAALDAEGGGGT